MSDTILAALCSLANDREELGAGQDGAVRKQDGQAFLAGYILCEFLT
jgi:hypothetical protein